MGQTVKYIKETDDAYTIGGYGVVWGGADLLGDHFTPDSVFFLDHLSQTPPVLYEHGMDAATKKAVLGQVVVTKADDTGMWIEAQLEKSRSYVDAVMELVNAGVLGWSSGAISHLVERKSNGWLSMWPIVEFSLTPDPAEPRTLGVHDLSGLDDEPQIKSLIAAIEATEKPDPDLDIPEAEPLTLTAARFAEFATTLAERTKGLSQRRAAEGRPLSAANVGQIAKAKAAALNAIAELDALVADDSEPSTKDSTADGLRTRIAIQAERIRMLAS